MKIQRALISVSDKTGLIPFAKRLNDLGVEILSTGGTAKAISDEGIPVIEISDYTSAPEMDKLIESITTYAKNNKNSSPIRQSQNKAENKIVIKSN